jgi:transposase InsO family protein
MTKRRRFTPEFKVRVVSEVLTGGHTAAVGETWQNGYAERLIRTIKEVEVNLSDHEDYTDACRQLGHFLDEVYTLKRIHSSSGYLTPAEFACPPLGGGPMDHRAGRSDCRDVN